MRLLLRKKEQTKLLLIPIYHHRTEESCRHFTLLVLSRVEGDMQVEYFDSLHQVHQGNLRHAKAQGRHVGFSSSTTWGT